MNRSIIGFLVAFSACIASGAVSSSPVSVSNVASLKGLAAGAYPYALVMGYRTPSDSGGFPVRWDPASSSSPDSCSVFKPTSGPSVGRWIRIQDGKPLSARSCGAYGDGTHDDYAYLVAWKAASKSLFLPRGRYRHTQTLRWTVKGQQLTGEGSYSAFFPDMGSSSDGHVFGDSTTGVNNLLIQNVAFFCDSTCRDAVVMLGVFRSRFENVFVNGSISYDVYIRGALTNYFNLIISKNVTYPYPSGGFNNLNGLIRVGPRIVIGTMGGVATNANLFDVTLEGGAFSAGSEASYFQETQDFEGDNTIYGTIQGMSGPAIQVNTSTSFRVSNLHGEASGRIIVNNCKNFTIDAWRTEQVNIQDFSSNTKIIGTEIYGANVIIGANCTYTTLIGLTYTAGAALVDSSTTTTQIGSPSYAQIPGGLRVGASTITYPTKQLTVIGSDFDATSLQMENTDVGTAANGRMFNFGITDVSSTEGRMDLTIPGVMTTGSVFKSGNWGLGSTTDGGEKLQVTGTARVTGALAAYDNITLATAGKGVIYQAGPKDLAGSGSPEGAVTASVGSTYRRSDGGAGTSFYVKESGSGNTGWVGK